MRRKSRFLLFCWSLIPGAGHMYLGFMKMGVSLMLGFALATTVVGVSGLGILSALPLVVWFYSFFHANNLGSMSDEEFYNIKDNYLFFADGEDSLKAFATGKYRKAAAVALIIIGSVMLWDVFNDTLFNILGKELYNMYFREISHIINNYVPRLVVGIAIIWFGVKLIRGKKEEMDKLED